MKEQSFDMDKLVELASELRDEKLTPERKEHLESILHDSAEARSYFLQFMRLHGLFEQRAIGIEAKDQQHVPAIRPERSPRIQQRTWAAAAAIVIIALVWWANDSTHPENDSVHTRLIGDWKLSTSDENSYSILDETRIRLESGELLLSSTQPSANPLHVETTNGTATLTGKKFLIGNHTSHEALRKKAQTRVLVLNGNGKLTNPAGSVSGNDGDLLIVDESETPPIQLAVHANSSFGLDLYRELTQIASNENLLLSPYSIALTLSMTAEGTRGDAAQELWKALHFPESAQRLGEDTQHIPWEIAKIHTGMKEWSERLQDRESLTFTLANCLWVDKRFPFQKPLLKTLNEAHGALLHEADFRDNAATERARLNDRVSMKTNGLVKNLLPDHFINEETRIVLANATYFMGKWDNPFFHEVTQKDADFTLTDGRKVKATYLQKSFTESYRAGEETKNRINRFRYGELKTQGPNAVEFQALEIPYEGKSLSMLVLLPQKNNGLPTLERELTPENVFKWVAKLKEEAVSVVLPRFRIQSELSLRNALEELGVITAFRPGGFSRMSTAPDAAKELYLSRVHHQAIIEINETGTEVNSSSLTLTQGASVTRSPHRPRTFSANHPFLFLIRDQRTGAILFVGRLLDPSQS